MGDFHIISHKTFNDDFYVVGKQNMIYYNCTFKGKVDLSYCDEIWFIHNTFINTYIDYWYCTRTVQEDNEYEWPKDLIEMPLPPPLGED